jgi:hypothetical protein
MAFGVVDVNPFSFASGGLVATAAYTPIVMGLLMINPFVIAYGYNFRNKQKIFFRTLPKTTNTFNYTAMAISVAHNAGAHIIQTFANT